MKTLFALLRDTFQEWNEDKAPRLAAALAYYTVFSIAPFLVVVIAVAGLVFGQEAVRGQLFGQIQGMVGAEGAGIIQELLQSAYKPSTGILATVIGLVTLLFGAIGVFAQLEDALNTVWDVEPKPSNGILGAIKDRFISFTMLLGVGFLLLVSLVISAGLNAVDNFVMGLLPGAQLLMQLVNFVVSFGVITFLFALMFKFLPDVEIQWRDVWIGAAVTALLFNVGKFALGLYLGNSNVATAYGAAGSLVIILLWVYYSAQIVLFGAEFTQVYAKRYGSHRMGLVRQATAPGSPTATRETVSNARPGITTAQKPIALLPPPANGSNSGGSSKRRYTVLGIVTTVAIMIASWLLGSRNKGDRATQN